MGCRFLGVRALADQRGHHPKRPHCSGYAVTKRSRHWMWRDRFVYLSCFKASLDLDVVQPPAALFAAPAQIPLRCGSSGILSAGRSPSDGCTRFATRRLSSPVSAGASEPGWKEAPCSFSRTGAGVSSSSCKNGTVCVARSSSSSCFRYQAALSHARQKPSLSDHSNMKLSIRSQ